MATTTAIPRPLATQPDAYPHQAQDRLSPVALRWAWTGYGDGSRTVGR